MMGKKSTPFSQGNGPGADKFNFMVVGETGQGKTAAGIAILHQALSKATGAGLTGCKIKGNRNVR